MTEQKLCELCVFEKDTKDDKKATGFCQNCDGYLCTECVRTHKLTKLFRKHVLFELGRENSDSKLDSYIEHKLGRPVDLVFQQCKRHGSELTGFYCKTHDTIGCGTCMILNHRECDVKHFHVLDDEVFGSFEYQQSKMGVERLLEEVKQFELTVKEQTLSGKPKGAACKSKIIKLRNEIDKRMDELQNKIMSEIDEHDSSNDRMFETIGQTCDYLKHSLSEKLEAFNDQLVLRHRGKAFVMHNRVKKELPEFNNRLKAAKVSVEYDVKTFNFIPSCKVTTLLEIDSLGDWEENVTGCEEFNSD